MSNDSQSDTPGTGRAEDDRNQLRSIVRRIDSFFESQLARLQTALTQIHQEQAQLDATRRMAADLDRQRRQWEQEKQQEAQRLAAASASLATAWAELENRERQLNRPARPQTRPDMTPTPDTPPAQPKPEPALTAQAAPVAETTQFEMEMLQQQVAEHARRTRG